MKSSRLNYFLAFLLPITLIVTAFYLLDLYPFSDKMATSGDFSTQYQPLYFALKKVISDGDWMALYWSFHKGLGGAMSAVYGFNSLSPLTIGLALLPATYFMPGLLVIMLLRYGLTGLAMYAYLDKSKGMSSNLSYAPMGQGDSDQSSLPSDTTKELNGGLIPSDLPNPQGKKLNYQNLLKLFFAMAYSLSGYMIANHYNPNFLDNLIYYPIIVLMLERLLDGQRSKSYPWMIALMCITQFYTAFMGALGLGLYAIYYLMRQEMAWTLRWKRWAAFLGQSLLGVGLCAIWLLPVFFNLLASKAQADGLFEIQWQGLFPLHGLVLKWLPAMASFEEWGDSKAMPQVYISSLGILGIIQTFFNTKQTKRYKTCTLAFLLVFIFSFYLAPLDLVWHMGQRPVGFYFRNAWVFSFFAISLAYRAWVDQPQIERRHLVFYSILPLWALLAYLTLTLKFGSLQIVLLGVCLWTILIFSLTLRPSKWVQALILLLAGTDLAINSLAVIRSVPFYNSLQGLQDRVDFYNLQPIKALADPDPFYRADMNNSGLNVNLFFDANPVGHFTSSIEHVMIETFAQLGLPSSKAMVNYQTLPVTDALFGVKYSAHPNNSPAYYQPLLSRQELKGQFNVWNKLYYNPNHLALGFLVPKSFNQFQFIDRAPIANQEALVQSLLGQAGPYFQEQDLQLIESLNLQPTGDLWTRVKEHAPTQITYQASGLDPQAQYYLQIPRHVTFYLPFAQVTLNGQDYELMDRFIAPQIWPAFVDPEGKLTFEIQSNQVDKLDLTGLRLYSFDYDAFEAGIQAKKADNLVIQSVTNKTIKAQVSVNDPSKAAVFMSLPYSKGWQLQVDGQSQTTYPVWETFTGFDLTLGDHDIILSYQPPGFKLGAGISALSMLVFVLTLAKTYLKKEQTYETNRPRNL